MKTPSYTKYIAIILINLTFFVKSYGQNKLEDSIRSIMKTKHLPGLLVSIIKNDSVINYAYGKADLKENISLTTSHSFKIGSVTKSFTALSIMKLIEEGKLHLETNIEETFPEIPIKNRFRKAKPVKLHHLLEHKAGFDDMHFSAFQNRLNRIATAEEEMKAHIKSLEVRWQPGLVHSYSNSGYVILGYIIEKLSNKSYTQYVTENFLGPLEMTNTFFHEGQSRNIKKGKGYYWSDGYKQAPDFKLMGQSAGGLWSNSDDLTKLIEFYINKGVVGNDTILSPSYFDEMESLHGWVEQKNNFTTGYGLGVYTRQFGKNNMPFWGHSGGILGYGADFIYNRKLKTGIAVINNGQRGNKEILNLLVTESIDQNNYSDKIKSTEVSEPTKYQAWEGHYMMKNSRNEIFRFIDVLISTLEIKVTEETVLLKPLTENEKDLVNVSSNSFLLHGDNLPNVYFVKLDGKNVVYYDNDLYVKSSQFLVWAARTMLILSILITGFMIIYLLIHLIKLLFQKDKYLLLKEISILSLPHVCITLFFLIFFSLIPLENIVEAGTFNTKTAVIYLLSLAIPIFILFKIGYFYLHKKTKKINGALIVVSLFSSMFLCGYMFYFDLIGLALWSY